MSRSFSFYLQSYQGRLPATIWISFIHRHCGCDQGLQYRLCLRSVTRTIGRGMRTFPKLISSVHGKGQIAEPDNDACSRSIWRLMHSETARPPCLMAWTFGCGFSALVVLGWDPRTRPATAFMQSTAQPQPRPTAIVLDMKLVLTIKR